MHTDDLDPEAYRRWWEAEGRRDVNTCPCGEPADDIVELDSMGMTGVTLPRREGFCARHGGFRKSVTRETFAGWIADGTFHEHDLTDDEYQRARLVADGFYGSGDKAN
jgi:hypothetical protein